MPHLCCHTGSLYVKNLILFFRISFTVGSICHNVNTFCTFAHSSSVVEFIAFGASISLSWARVGWRLCSSTEVRLPRLSFSFLSFILIRCLVVFGFLDSFDSFFYMKFLSFKRLQLWLGHFLEMALLLGNL